ncbi:MAG: hypothetical protein AAF789_12390, partial [Bacteroidota bacterium]
GYVHPSRESILSYFQISDHSEGEYLSISEKDEMDIDTLIASNRLLIHQIFHLNIYPSLFNLKAISTLGIDSLQTNSLYAFQFEDYNQWIEIVELAKKIHQK